MSYQVKNPILFLAFNRPDCTQRVFDSIRQVKPRKLYIAIDGPRQNRQDDVENRDRVLAIVKKIDWDCEAKYLIHDNNLGCSCSGVTAWKWFFDYEETMIFIEDDGLGNESAFRFMDELLEKYQDDERVLNIGAVNYGPKSGNASYFFTRQPASTYFMGTWKRVFLKYEYDIASYKQMHFKKAFRNSFSSWREYLYLTSVFNRYTRHLRTGFQENTYDVQLQYLAYRYNMFSIYPNVNLVSNIGLNGGANNHVEKDSAFYSEYANRKREDLGVIVHKIFEVDVEFERSFFDKRVLYNRPWLKKWIIYSISDDYFLLLYKIYTFGKSLLGRCRSSKL